MRHSRIRLLSIVVGLLALLPASIRAQQSLSNSTPFIIPVGLESPVEFWKRVFSEFSLSQLIFFDPLDMSKIYEVIEVGEGGKLLGAKMTDDAILRMRAGGS